MHVIRIMFPIKVQRSIASVFMNTLFESLTAAFVLLLVMVAPLPHSQAMARANWAAPPTSTMGVKASPAHFHHLSTEPLSRLHVRTAAERKPIMLVAQAAVSPKQTRQKATPSALERIQNFLRQLVNDPDSKAILFGVVLTLIAIGILIFIVKLSNRLLLKANTRIESWRGTRIPALKIQTLEVISADRLTDMLKGIAKAVRITALIVVLYIFIPLILSFFPWTRGLVETILPYIISPVYILFGGFVSFLPNLFFITIIIFVTRYILKFTRLIFTEIRNERIAFPGFHVEWADPTSKLMSFLIIVFAVVLISPYLPGFGSPAFQGVSIFLGVLLSLGSTAVVANMVAGAALTYMRPFKVGDRVKIADTAGDVIEKTLLLTRVRTMKNVEITIPNAMVLGTHMINFSRLARESGLILHTSITIGYDVAWRKVEGLLMDAAHATRDILKDPGPFVLQTHLNDFSVTYELNGSIADPKLMSKVSSELIQRIQDKFNEAGVEILSPHYAAIRDGNQTVMPENYLPKATDPKGFRILPLGDLFGARGGSRSS